MSKEIFGFTLEIDGREVECRAHYCYSAGSHQTRDEPAESEMVEIGYFEIQVPRVAWAGTKTHSRLIDSSIWIRVSPDLEGTLFDMEKLQERILENVSDDSESRRDEDADRRMDEARGN